VSAALDGNFSLPIGIPRQCICYTNQCCKFVARRDGLANKTTVFHARGAESPIIAWQYATLVTEGRRSAMSSAPTVRFRPFQLELQTYAAGSHDGTKAMISLSFSTDGMVVTHEAIHERIFATTPDGHLLAVLARLVLQREDFDPAPPPTLDDLNMMLFDASRFAHEAVATYLGVKYLSPVNEPRAVASLPSDYQCYYRALSDVIDPVFRSSYLQALIGWNVAVVTFSSPLLARFVAADLGTPLQLHDNEHPEKRIRTLIDLLRHHDLTALERQVQMTAAETCRALGVEPWDVQSEGAWEAHRAIGDSVEVEISSVARAWLQQESGLPVLTDDAQHEAFDRLAALVGRYGLSMQGAEALDVLDTQYPRADLVEAYWLAASVTDNAQGANGLPRVDDHFLVSRGDVLFQTLHSFGIISAHPPQHLSECNLLAWPTAPEPGEPPRVVGRFSMAATLEWLGRRRDYEQQNFLMPTVYAITIAVRDFKDLDAMMPKFFDKTTFGDGTGTKFGSAASVTCWYWAANWFDIVHFMAMRHPVQLATIYPESSDAWAVQRNTSRSFDQFPELCIKVLKVPGLLGFVIRAFNFHAIASLNAYEASLRRKGVVHELDDDMLRYATGVVSFAVASIRKLWPTF